MRVLLLGGTGAMGVYLSKILSDKGVDIYITSRGDRENEGNITYVKGSAKDIDFLKDLLANKWDAIVDFMIYDTAMFKDRVDLLLKSTSQYVYLSSGRVYAETNGKITEENPRLLDVTNDEKYLATDEYALTKARQENILQESEKRNWTIIRPYITYGKERLQLGVLEKEYWLYRALNKKSIVFNEEIASKTTTLTSGYDVARAMAGLIGNPKTYGEVFHIANNNPIVWSKVLDVYLEVLEKHCGVRPKVKMISLPKFMSCFELAYQVRYDRLFNREFDNSKIGQYINVDEFTQTEKGMRDMLVQFIEHPKFRIHNNLLMAKLSINASEGSLYDYTIVGIDNIKKSVKKILKFTRLR